MAADGGGQQGLIVIEGQLFVDRGDAGPASGRMPGHRLKGDGGGPGVEFMDRLVGLAGASSWLRLAAMDSGLVRPGRHSGPPPIRSGGSTQGLRRGVNPDSHPWADAADWVPGAR